MAPILRLRRSANVPGAPAFLMMAGAAPLVCALLVMASWLGRSFATQRRQASSLF